jgi:hypothetical protein
MTKTLYHTEAHCYMCHTLVCYMISDTNEDMAGILTKNRILAMCNKCKQELLVSKEELMST